MRRRTHPNCSFLHPLWRNSSNQSIVSHASGSNSSLPDQTAPFTKDVGIDPLCVHVLVRGCSEVNDDLVFANLRRVLGAVIRDNGLSQSVVPGAGNEDIEDRTIFHHGKSTTASLCPPRPHRGFEGNTRLSRIIPRLPARPRTLFRPEVHFLSSIPCGHGTQMYARFGDVSNESLLAKRRS